MAQPVVVTPGQGRVQPREQHCVLQYPIFLDRTKANCGLKFYQPSLIRFHEIFESLPCFGVGVSNIM